MGLIRPRNKDHKSISLTLTDDSVPMKHEEKALTLAEAETWRLADVKQMAATAAATGQAGSSFKNQLRPIDRYVMRLLELWDPIINKVTVSYQVNVAEE